MTARKILFFSCALFVSITCSKSERIGNALQDRQYATDHSDNVFVIDFPVSMSGTLRSILTHGQAMDSLGFSSQGYVFNTYILRPAAGGYTVEIGRASCRERV